LKVDEGKAGIVAHGGEEAIGTESDGRGRASESERLVGAGERGKQGERIGRVACEREAVKGARIRQLRDAIGEMVSGGQGAGSFLGDRIGSIADKVTARTAGWVGIGRDVGE